MIGLISRSFFYSARRNLSSIKSSSLGKLRKSTGYSVSNCKQALEMFPDDVAKAEEWLHAESKKKGWSKWTKMQSRSATQGLIGVFSRDTFGIMVEVNCETDFVAKNVEFHQLVERILSGCVSQIPTFSKENVTKMILDESQLSTIQLNSGTVGELVNSSMSKFNEKTVAKRAVYLKVPNGLDVASFSHPNFECPDLLGASLGKYGTLLTYKKTAENSDESLVQSLCQHIIGMNPQSTGELTAQDIANFKKKSSLEESSEEESKEAVKAEGNKEGEEQETEGQDSVTIDVKDVEEGEEQETEGQESVTVEVKDVDETRLLFQTFLLDPDVTVGEAVHQNGLEVVDFERFECGQSQFESCEVKEVQSAAV